MGAINNFDSNKMKHFLNVYHLPNALLMTSDHELVEPSTALCGQFWSQSVLLTQPGLKCKILTQASNYILLGRNEF